MKRYSIVGTGDRLREERLRLGMNQTDFAEAAGVKKNSQSNYEKGDRNPDSAYLTAIASMGADVMYVLTGVRSAPVADQLSPRAAALLDNYEQLSDEDQRAIERLASAIQKPMKGQKSGTEG